MITLPEMYIPSQQLQQPRKGSVSVDVNPLGYVSYCGDGRFAGLMAGNLDTVSCEKA